MSKIHGTVCLVDEGSVELIAAYEFSKSEGLSITSLEVVIAGKGIEILDKLDQKQYDAICEDIKTEEDL